MASRMLLKSFFKPVKAPVGAQPVVVAVKKKEEEKEVRLYAMYFSRCASVCLHACMPACLPDRAQLVVTTLYRRRRRA